MYNPNGGYPKVVPYILYADPAAAIRWLSDVLNLRETVRFTMPDGTVGHAELETGGHIVIIGLDGGRHRPVSSITLVFVDDIDAKYERAMRAGWSSVDEPNDQPFGLRQALIEDPAGQRWEISQYLRDVPPSEWGATVPPKTNT